MAEQETLDFLRLVASLQEQTGRQEVEEGAIAARLGGDIASVRTRLGGLAQAGHLYRKYKLDGSGTTWLSPEGHALIG